MNENQDQFNVLRKIKSKPNSSQRELASELGFSLGKLNYCLNALKDKGLIKYVKYPVKILGNGDIDTSININVDFFSDSAKSKIEKAGGKAQTI